MRRWLATLILPFACISSGVRAVDFEINEDMTFSVFGEFQFLYLLDEERLISDVDGSLDEPEEMEEPDKKKPAPPPPPCTPMPCNSGDERFEGVNELVDNDSTFGVSGEYILENGLTAYFLVEWEYQADEEPEEDGGLSSTGDSYIGLAGEFGTVQLGNSDGIYSDAILDVIDNFEYGGPTEYTFSSEAGDLLSYQSPDFEGFSFAIQTSLKGDGAGIDNDPVVIPPPPAAAPPPDPSPADEIYPLMLVLAYEADLFSVRLGYDDRQLVHEDAEPQIGVAATLDLEPFSFGIKYETIGESRDDVDDGVELVGLIATYDYEVGEVSLAVQEIKFDEEIPNQFDIATDATGPPPVDFSVPANTPNQIIDFDTEVGDLREDRTEVILHANYKLSEFITFYFETAVYDAAEDLGNYTGLGTVFEF